LKIKNYINESVKKIEKERKRKKKNEKKGKSKKTQNEGQLLRAVRMCCIKEVLVT